jgi:hypothetical protein
MHITTPKLYTLVTNGKGNTIVETTLDPHNEVFYRNGQGLYGWVTRDYYLTLTEEQLRDGTCKVKFGQYGTNAKNGSTPQDTIQGYLGTTVDSVVIVYAVRMSAEQVNQVGSAYIVEQQVGRNLGNKSKFGSSTEVFETNLAVIEEEVNKVLYPHIFDEFFYSKKQTYRLRLRQEEAVNKFLTYFKKTHKKGEVDFLLGAVPRFGKNFTSLSMANKVIPSNGNVLMLTGRPDVFASLKYDVANHEAFIDWQYDELKDLKYKWRPSSTKKNLLAVSTQLLTNTKHRKKLVKLLSEFTWDARLIDEADTVMLTEQSTDLLKKIPAPTSIWITGTYWKLISTGRFVEKNMYTYDYVQQQQDKKNKIDTRAITLNWYTLNVLPTISDQKKWYANDEGFTLTKLFGFNEETGKFNHEADVQMFLQSVFGIIPKTHFSPYKITPELKHTLWLLPPSINGVLRLKHLIDVVTNGEYEVFAATSNEVEDITEVTEFLRWNKHKKTVVLTIGRFTRGTTVPEWDATFLLSDTQSAELYFQVAFRPASPADGKQFGYVFDFNPNRALLMIAEYARHSAQRRGITNPSVIMQEFLDNFNIFGVAGGVEFKKKTLEDILDTIRESDYNARTLRSSGTSYIKLDNISNKLLNMILQMDVDATKRLKLPITSSSELMQKGKNYKTVAGKNTVHAKVIDNKKRIIEQIATLMSRLPIICELGYTTVEEIVEKLPDDLFYGATKAEKRLLELLIKEKVIDLYKVNLQLSQ